MENQRIIQVEDKVPFNLLVPLSIQHMFAMFGASILVPFIFGINPAVVLFMNGVGTLLFIGVTKGKAPAYLGSSFAFLAPAGVVISNFGYNMPWVDSWQWGSAVVSWPLLYINSEQNGLRWSFRRQPWARWWRS